MSNEAQEAHFAKPVVDAFITKRMAVATNGSTVVAWSDYRDILSYISHVQAQLAQKDKEIEELKTDCCNPQCKQVHNYLDAELDCFGLTYNKDAVSVCKAATIMIHHNSLQSEFTTLREQVSHLQYTLSLILGQCEQRADGAPDASPLDRFCNEMVGLARGVNVSDGAALRKRLKDLEERILATDGQTEAEQLAAINYLRGLVREGQ